MPEHSMPYTWVLTEGIAGTENQCIGIAEAMGVPYSVKRIKLKPLWRILTPWLSVGAMQSLAKGSDSLAAPWPSLLITSGRKSIIIGKYVKKMAGRKCFHLHLQDPRILPSGFDAVVVPQHDPLRGQNVIVAKTALNRVTPEILADAAKTFGPQYDDLPRPRVAVLIGGNSKAHQMTAEDTARLCTQLTALTEKYGASLMVTASRRTGDANRSYLQQHLTSPHIRFWDGNGENPYFGFLALADYIIVTEDSVSMASEALATGKPVYIAKLTGGGRRLDQFHALLQQQGYTRPFTGQLEEWSYEPLHETQRIAKAVHGMIAAKQRQEKE